jgi:hypothetical protein
VPSAVPPSFGVCRTHRDRRPGELPWRSALPGIAGALRRSLLARSAGSSPASFAFGPEAPGSIRRRRRPGFHQPPGLSADARRVLVPFIARIRVSGADGGRAGAGRQGEASATPSRRARARVASPRGHAVPRRRLALLRRPSAARRRKRRRMVVGRRARASPSSTSGGDARGRPTCSPLRRRSSRRAVVCRRTSVIWVAQRRTRPARSRHWSRASRRPASGVRPWVEPGAGDDRQGRVARIAHVRRGPLAQPEDRSPGRADDARMAARAAQAGRRTRGRAWRPRRRPFHHRRSAARDRVGGEGGIRTHEVLRLSAFQERRHQPLGHLSRPPRIAALPARP